MSWLEEIDCRAFGEADFWILFSKIAFSDNIDLLIERTDIYLGGLNGAKDE